MMEDRGLKRIKKRHVIMTVIVLLVVLVISIPVFLYFKFTTESRMALREAKNVKLALNMLDIEYYAKGKTVYNPNNINGLTDGVMQEVSDVLEHDCSLAITSYDKKERKVLGFVYNYEHYQVVYRFDKDKGDTWKVSYILNILDYDGE